MNPAATPESDRAPVYAAAMSDRRESRTKGLAAACCLAVALVGCESGDEPKPMDEPLTHRDAMEADARMRGEAGKLLEERPDLLRSEPAEPKKSKPRRGL